MTSQHSKTFQCPLFQGMTPDEREHVLALLETEQYPKGETILVEGRRTQRLWVIVQGKCEVIKTKKNGSDQRLVVLERGAVFGEMSFLHPAPHSATVRTLTAVEVMQLTRKRYDQLLETCPSAAHKIALNIIHVLAERVRQLDDWICELVDRTDGGKIREEWQDFRSKLFSDWQF